jgi:catechol 2,3-dioxygenase-like lactoylglutathione lyase family enzyme
MWVGHHSCSSCAKRAPTSPVVFSLTETGRPPLPPQMSREPSWSSRRSHRVWPGEEQMNLQKIYTALLTADLAAAEGWYTKLLGRGPDYRPIDTLVQWELFDQGGVALSTDDEIAGRGVMFLVVDDVAAERRRLQGLGIVLGDDIEGDYSTLAQVRDPDGNLLTLATPPSRPFPPA